MISLKVILIFSKNFLDFRSDTVEKMVITNLRRYSSKNYASVIFSAVKVAFLGEREDAAFHQFFYCILFTHSVG